MQNTFISPVAVALSGGADSLYTLISLKEAGIPVIGIHGKFIPLDVLTMYNPQGEEAAAEHTAAIAQVCKSLDVPFYCVGLQDIFLEHVIRPFVEAYAQGETPNPCALCNSSIKFGLLLDNALKLGAKHLATGHYARLINEQSNDLSERSPCLLQGKDPFKDQSYFLALVPKKQLCQAIFPLGEEKKSEVLACLARWGIIPPAPIESQEVCFISSGTYREFLPVMARKLGISLSSSGPMLVGDKVIGNHQGLWNYTEGQRKGLGVAWKEPLHVIHKDKEKNAIVLGPKHEAVSKGIKCEHINILWAPENWPEIVYVKARYREQPRPAKFRLTKKNLLQEGEQSNTSSYCLEIDFLSTESSIAKGQLAAVYVPVPEAFEEDGRPLLRLVAGGLISTVYRPN